MTELYRFDTQCYSVNECVRYQNEVEYGNDNGNGRRYCATNAFIVVPQFDSSLSLFSKVFFNQKIEIRRCCCC